jgi:hypothetical protein
MADLPVDAWIVGLGRIRHASERQKQGCSELHFLHTDLFDKLSSQS